MNKVELVKAFMAAGATMAQAHKTAVYLLAVDYVRAYDGNWQAMIEDVCKLNHWQGAE